MRLYGTYTSPFVRRVRIVAMELGEPVDLVQAHTPAGDAELRAITPLWKVPVAVFHGETLFDSRVICEQLVATRGSGALRPTSPADRNVITVADDAADSAINWFYLVRRDGGDPAQPYLVKQMARVESALEWLAARLQGASFDPAGELGFAEISLLTTLEWMAYRNVHPVREHPVLGAFMAAWAERPAVLATRPP